MIHASLAGMKLSEEQMRVAQIRVIDLKSLEEAAKELGISEKEVKELEEQVVAKLLS